MVVNTENSHLRYWYNEDRNAVWRTNELDTTSMSIGGCTRKPMTLKAELVRNARALKHAYPNLTVFMSGGLDSEIALRSFLAAGIVPRLATIKFVGDNNNYDIGPMLHWVTGMGLKCDVIQFDPQEFFDSGECYEIGLKYQAYTFYQQMLLRIAETLEIPMITVDEVELEKLPTMNWETGEYEFKWSFLKKEDQDGVWRRFADKTGIPALNNFYTYSPESMLAFLQESTVAELIRDRIPFKYGWTSSKMKIYGSLGYDFRPRPKWHGMENYYHIWDSVIYNMPSKGLAFNPRQYKVDALQLEQNLINGVETVCQVA